MDSPQIKPPQAAATDALMPFLPTYGKPMMQLASKPIFLSLVLVLPLWVVLGNFIVAAIGALLLAFLVAMCRSLYLMKRNRRAGNATNSTSGSD